jgi:FKBP-type peptidyl-prolyl cis-trans isomerase FkpA
MKKYLLLLCVVFTAFTACKKEKPFDAAAQAIEDDNNIKAYIAANNITGITKDPKGFYYKVMTPGNGTYPTISSNVTVTYNGKLLDGSQFDTGSGIKFPLSGVIEGWQLGIPKIDVGGRLLLIVPSALGYGNQGQQGLPANSVLIFTVDLLSIN